MKVERRELEDSDSGAGPGLYNESTWQIFAYVYQPPSSRRWRRRGLKYSFLSSFSLIIALFQLSAHVCTSHPAICYQDHLLRTTGDNANRIRAACSIELSIS